MSLRCLCHGRESANNLIFDCENLTPLSPLNHETPFNRPHSRRGHTDRILWAKHQDASGDKGQWPLGAGF